jgi:DNA mismatch endonuclease, patch repair protein
VARGVKNKQAFKRPLSQGESPLYTTPQRSRQMAAVRRSGTAPELAVRKILSSDKVRYTLENRDLPGSPDIANRSKRFAVFVHGCFWHRHSGCRRTTTPKANLEFWQEKFATNVRRDRRVAAALRRLGYRVTTVWECECSNELLVKAKLGRLLSRTRK